MERKEAIEVIKKNWPDSSFTMLHEALETLIPELKESEDERIRRALKEYFINSFQNNGVAAICGVHIKDILAWLEKKGKNNMGISESTKQKLEDNLNNALEKETPESCNEFLEKQCEQKSYASETMNEKGDFDSGFTRMMEKEQKPVDKIKPKFKVGDNIHRKDVRMYPRIVIDILKDNYILRRTEDCCIEELYFVEQDNWEIVKEPVHRTRADVDTDKLESRNIGQKPTFEMMTPEESLAKSEDEMIRKDLLYWLYSYKDGNEAFVPAGDVDVWISYLEKQCEQQDHSKFLDSIQIGDQVTRNEDGVLVNLSQLKRVAKTEDKVEKKPAWSEEDESCLNTTIAYLKDAKEFKKTAENCINWLKSLKDRVHLEAE